MSESIERVIRVGEQISQIKDLDLLMEGILTVVRRFVNSDAGSIYLRRGDELEFSYTQNETLQKRLPKGKKLIYNTFTLPIDSHTIAGYVATTGEELNVDDVYELDPSLPCKFGEEFDAVSHYRTRSMFTLPLKTIRNDVVGVLQVINAHDTEGKACSFSQDDAMLIRHFAHAAAVALERAQLTRTVFLRMIGMAQLRDPKETGPHVNRVAAYATELYEAWAMEKGVSGTEIEQTRDVLRSAALLHDVGKVGIPDVILKKPARLTDVEYAEMQQHTLIGAHLFADPKSEFDEAAAEVVINHHECWDGNGYPGHVDPTTGKPLSGFEAPDGTARGKKGLEIPLLGRLVAIADVYDALSSPRCYKEAWANEDVMAEMQSQAGRQFDPELVETFLSIQDLVEAIKARYPDED